MAKSKSGGEAAPQRRLHTQVVTCPECGKKMWCAYVTDRVVATLTGQVRIRAHVRRCREKGCRRYHKPYHPEEEGSLALPDHEFGLDVIALVGTLRYRQHRSVPEIHQELTRRGVAICERTVTNLLDRYDELVAVKLCDGTRLKAVLKKQGKIILGLDGLQPDVGHEVLWVLRDCISGEVLLARSLLSCTQSDLAALIKQACENVGVPVAGAVSDGQHSIRNAVAAALPDIPHQLCHFHYLREAARPIYEMDRHAKKELKKQVRGIRPIERAVEQREDPQAQAVKQACSAVRSAITDDGRPPLRASGLRLRTRLTAIRDSLERVEKRGRRAESSARCDV